MIAAIQQGWARGSITAPPSKSMTHRMLICAALAEGESHIRGVSFSEDVLATIDCLRALGAEVSISGDVVTVRGVNMRRAKLQGALCCRESGSTLRFLIPLTLLSGEKTTFCGTETLLSRPLHVYADLCRDHGFTFEQHADRLEVCGRLTAGEFRLPGDVSSQFVTGLLFALPLLAGDSTITLAPPVESRSYIDLTLQALHTFGIRAHWQDACTLIVPGDQRYTTADAAVEGDYSNTAFFAALNALGGDIDIGGLNGDSLQGDKVYTDHFQSLCDGCPTIDIADCPDLGPILFAVAAAKHGAVFTNTRRLRDKESDRVSAMAKELSAFGTEVWVEEDRVEIVPKDFHRPERLLSGHNDHRIVMALSVLLTLTGGTIEGAEAVRKSFPDFFDKLKAVGVDVSATL